MLPPNFSFQVCAYLRNHRIRSVCYSVVPEAHNLETFRYEIGRALPVLRLSAVMRITIQFNHQSPTQAGEIRDITSDRMLAPELASHELAVAKACP